jgi:hypothetical protein
VIEEFRDDDAGFLTWIGTYPEGYVLNIQRGLSPQRRSDPPGGLRVTSSGSQARMRAASTPSRRSDGAPASESPGSCDGCAVGDWPSDTCATVPRNSAASTTRRQELGLAPEFWTRGVSDYAASGRVATSWFS